MCTRTLAAGVHRGSVKIRTTPTHLRYINNTATNFTNLGRMEGRVNLSANGVRTRKHQRLSVVAKCSRGIRLWGSHEVQLGHSNPSGTSIQPSLLWWSPIICLFSVTQPLPTLNISDFPLVLSQLYIKLADFQRNKGIKLRTANRQL